MSNENNEFIIVHNNKRRSVYSPIIPISINSIERPMTPGPFLNIKDGIKYCILDLNNNNK